MYQEFEWAVLRMEALVVQDDVSGERKTVKKWKDAPFAVKDVTIDDVTRYGKLLVEKHLKFQLDPHASQQL